MIYPVARLPDRWIEEGQAEGAHIDLSLKSDWQLFAAFDGSRPFGFIGLLLKSRKTCTVRGWFVFPEHRGRGVGTALLEHAMRWAQVNGYEKAEIRTAHAVDHLGFRWTGYQRSGGAQERHYVLQLTPEPVLPLEFAVNS